MQLDKEEFTKQKVSEQLALPNDNSDEQRQQIGIIKGLSTENDLGRIQLRLMGYSFDYFTNQWIPARRPVMNKFGIGNMMNALQSLGDLANFSNYDEKDIHKLALLFYEDNYPTFIIYANEFELDSKDFNIINSILKFYPLSVLKNAKNAGHRNVVRGTLSENLLQKAFEGNRNESKGGFLSFFRKK